MQAIDDIKTIYDSNTVDKISKFVVNEGSSIATGGLPIVSALAGNMAESLYDKSPNPVKVGIKGTVTGALVPVALPAMAAGRMAASAVVAALIGRKVIRYANGDDNFVKDIQDTHNAIKYRDGRKFADTWFPRFIAHRVS